MPSAAIVAVDYLKASGPRTGTRLRELVKSFAGSLNQDEESTHAEAIQLAKKLLDFNEAA